MQKRGVRLGNTSSSDSGVDDGGSEACAVTVRGAQGPKARLSIPLLIL
jgi:hypothetical protein